MAAGFCNRLVFGGVAADNHYLYKALQIDNEHFPCSRKPGSFGQTSALNQLPTVAVDFLVSCEDHDE